MVEAFDVEHKNEAADVLTMMLDAFLSPAPVKILMELGKRGKVYKSEFLEAKSRNGGSGVYWPTYTRYEEAFIRAGLIKITKEPEFPFRQTVELTDKGKEVIEHLESIARLIKTDYDRLPQGP
jgi:DNA-binding MarR family transcriptional regulator